MNIGKRLIELRTAKDLSQGDIEKRTGLKRSYISRVENGRTVPSLKTIQRLCKALHVSLFEFFYVPQEPPSTTRLTTKDTVKRFANKARKAGEEARFLLKLRRRLVRMGQKSRRLFMVLAKTLVKR